MPEKLCRPRFASRSGVGTVTSVKTDHGDTGTERETNAPKNKPRKLEPREVVLVLVCRPDPRPFTLQWHTLLSGRS